MCVRPSEKQLLRQLSKRIKNERCINMDKSNICGNGLGFFWGGTIGENTLIATGSIVIRSLPRNAITAGIQGNIVKRIDDR